MQIWREVHFNTSYPSSANCPHVPGSPRSPIGTWAARHAQRRAHYGEDRAPRRSRLPLVPLLRPGSRTYGGRRRVLLLLFLPHARLFAAGSIPVPSLRVVAVWVVAIRRIEVPLLRAREFRHDGELRVPEWRLRPRQPKPVYRLAACVGAVSLLTAGTGVDKLSAAGAPASAFGQKHHPPQRGLKMAVVAGHWA